MHCHSRKLYRALICLLIGFSIPLFGGIVQLQDKLGTKNINIIKNAKFVTILTLMPEGTQNRYGSIKEVHLSNEEKERLKTNILDDHNYDFNQVKSCHFVPEVSFKFQVDHEQVVHLFVNSSCHQMLFGMDTYSVLLNYDPAQERIDNFVQQLIKETHHRNKDKTQGS